MGNSALKIRTSHDILFCPQIKSLEETHILKCKIYAVFQTSALPEKFTKKKRPLAAASTQKRDMDTVMKCQSSFVLLRIQMRGDRRWVKLGRIGASRPMKKSSTI